jgi:hypothetical protein
MQDVFVHDNRLIGDSPSGSHLTLIPVSQSIPIDDMVISIRRASISHGTDIRLNILAHGFYTGDHGGYGIQLCREGLSLTTVGKLQPLNGYLSYGIDIYACGAAETAPWTVGQSGDGWTLCSRIASYTQSIVRAALLPQTYIHFGGIFGLFRIPINFGRWEGTVLTFDPRGRQIDQQESPNR